MDETTRLRLLEINRLFYRQQAASFAETRRRIQPGVARILAGLNADPGSRWLDLGCGNGWLAVEWLRRGLRGAYIGLDFSPELVDEARRTLTEQAGDQERRAEFRVADFSQVDWASALAAESYAGALCFAVLHHLPGKEQRENFLRQAADLLQPGCLLVFSVWQFDHSPRLVARQLPWERVDLEADRLEPGDCLLDWRHPPQAEPALRYVHLFSTAELAACIQQAGLSEVERFEADGEGGRLGLYWVCRK